MTCPYNRKKLMQISKLSNDLANEESGAINSSKQVISEEYELMECTKELCGVFYNGRCHYYTAPDETNE